MSSISNTQKYINFPEFPRSHKTPISMDFSLGAEDNLLSDLLENSIFEDQINEAFIEGFVSGRKLKDIQGILVSFMFKNRKKSLSKQEDKVLRCFIKECNNSGTFSLINLNRIIINAVMNEDYFFIYFLVVYDRSQTTITAIFENQCFIRANFISYCHTFSRGFSDNFYFKPEMIPIFDFLSSQCKTFDYEKGVSYDHWITHNKEIHSKEIQLVSWDTSTIIEKIINGEYTPIRMIDVSKLDIEKILDVLSYEKRIKK